MDPIRKELGSDAKMLPTIKIVPAPAPLGPGALAVEVKLTDLPGSRFGADTDGPSKKKADKVTFSVHLLLMPDGKQRTWIALGANRDELVKRLGAVKSGAPDSGTIAARPDLEKLKSGRHMSAGFMTLQSVVSPIASLGAIGGGLPREARQVIAALAGMPNRGETPLLITTSVTTGNLSRTEISFEVPKGAFEDLGAVVMKSMKAGGIPLP
jgi:hypothetical protein